MSFLSSFFGSEEESVGLRPGTIVKIGKRNVKVVEKIGEGGFSTVYLGTCKGKKYAIKHCRCLSEEQIELIDNEIKIMEIICNVKQKNIVIFYGYCKKETPRGPNNPKLIEYYILLEYISSSLISYIQKRQKENKYLSENLLLQMFLEITRGVAHVHNQNPPLAHRDLKIDNILLNYKNENNKNNKNNKINNNLLNFELKLCDFGSVVDGRPKIPQTSYEINQEMELIDRYTTQSYRAPEMIDLYRRKELSTKVDIWALGVIFYTLTFLEHPYPDGNKMAILDGTYTIPNKHPYNKKIIKIIKLLLQKNPKKRPTAAQLCNHLQDLLNGGKGTLTLKKSNKHKQQKGQSFIASPNQKSLLLKHEKSWENVFDKKLNNNNNNSNVDIKSNNLSPPSKDDHNISYNNEDNHIAIGDNIPRGSFFSQYNVSPPIEKVVPKFNINNNNKMNKNVKLIKSPSKNENISVNDDFANWDDFDNDSLKNNINNNENNVSFEGEEGQEGIAEPEPEVEIDERGQLILDMEKEFSDVVEKKEDKNIINNNNIKNNNNNINKESIKNNQNISPNSKKELSNKNSQSYEDELVFDDEEFDNNKLPDDPNAKLLVNQPSMDDEALFNQNFDNFDGFDVNNKLNDKNSNNSSIILESPKELPKNSKRRNSKHEKRKLLKLRKELRNSNSNKNNNSNSLNNVSKELEIKHHNSDSLSNSRNIEELKTKMIIPKRRIDPKTIEEQALAYEDPTARAQRQLREQLELAKKQSSNNNNNNKNNKNNKNNNNKQIEPKPKKEENNKNNKKNNKFKKQKSVSNTIEIDLTKLYEKQLKTLKNMGFSDETKGLMALSQAKGNVDLAIHFLVSQS